MGKHQRVLLKILQGGADANISFEDLCQLLQHLGFEERIRGSHHVFRKQGIEEKINLQRDGKHAKTYQVRQVRSIILMYGLEGED
jgi:predicted RNA binding protein YcfA (HicA-like mRNA interferase family)